MKALGQTSITALILGTGTAIYAAMTWPHVPDEGAGNLIGLSTGLVLVGIGILAGLLAMHANQITAASSTAKAPAATSSLTLPPPTEIFPEALPETK